MSSVAGSTNHLPRLDHSCWLPTTQDGASSHSRHPDAEQGREGDESARQTVEVPQRQVFLSANATASQKFNIGRQMKYFLDKQRHTDLINKGISLF